MLAERICNQPGSSPGSEPADGLQVGRHAVDKHDRRHTMVRLTPQGRRVLSGIKTRTEQHVRRSLTPLTVTEREQLVASMRVLTRVLAMPAGEEF